MNVIPGAEERGTAADTFRRLYWDTVAAWHAPNLHMLRSVVGMGQVLFGTDYPYLRRDLAVACRSEVQESSEINEDERGRVLAANALKLFQDSVLFRKQRQAARRGFDKGLLS
jgi:6-methylsalicylate decarboxylase